MRIRFKLLILLMVISLFPLLMVRTSIQRDLTVMGNNLAERSEKVLVHKARMGLKRIVEDHARVLRQERQLLESISFLIASRIEGVLYGYAHTTNDAPFIPSDVRMNEVLEEYFTLHVRDREQSLDVDFQQATFEGNKSDKPIMNNLIPLMGTAKFKYPKLILWIEMILSDGSRVTYPKVNDEHKIRRSQGEIDEASNLQRGLTWSLPLLDKLTRRLAFKVTAPIKNDEGKLLGNLSIVVPIDALLRENHHVNMFSDNVEAFLVKPAFGQGNRPPRLKVVAQEQVHKIGRGHWWVPEGEKWLTSDNAEQLGVIAADLFAQKTGVVSMPSYKDGDALWAYAPIDESGTSLLLIVPKDDIVKDAQAARDYVVTQVDEHDIKMGYVMLLVAGLVFGIALILSRFFTRNIRELVDAVQGVSRGDFSAKANVRSTDEIGQLGFAFNKMLPELHERVVMKHALEVAQEIGRASCRERV